MAIIYRIVVNDGTNEYFYYGSTETSLERRIWRHKTKKYYECPNRRLYKKIREVGGWKMVKYETILEVEGNGFDKEAEYVNNNLTNPLCLNSICVAKNQKKHIIHRQPVSSSIENGK